MGESETDNLAIVLNVIEGTGFDTRKNAIVIKANLGGNSLETDAVVPGDVSVPFKNNLIWSTNRGAIKRMKEENQPIKLECFVQSTDSHRHLIGIVLLPMLSIPFWSSRKIGMMKPHWYKLQGLSNDNKSTKPELLVSVTIGVKDDILNEDEKKLIPSERSTDANTTRVITNYLRSEADLIVEKLSKDEVCIIGIENTEQHHFAVEIHLNMIELKSHCFNDTLQLAFTLFDRHIVNLRKDVDANCSLIGETISIKLKASLSDLKAYFRNIFSLPIEIIASEETDIFLGVANLNFSDSLTALPSSVDGFQEIFAADDHTYQFDSFCEIDTSVNQTTKVEGAIHYGFCLKLIPTSNSEPGTPPNLMIPLSTLQTQTFNKISASPKLSPAAQLNEKGMIDMNNIREKYSDVQTSIPKTFSYTLSLLDCSFNKRPFPGIWRLSLQHSLADIPSVVRNLEINNIVVDQISFEDMNMRLYFTTYPEQLYDLIKSKSCVLTLKGPRGVRATAELDNHNILSQGKTKGIVLLENEQGEQIAMAHISVDIEEIGVNFNTESTFKLKRQQLQQQPQNAFLDEDIAYKMIEELEEWKQFQQREFLADLKRREIAHLTQLSNEWQRKRHGEELKLQRKMEQCERLTQTLEEAHIMFKERNRTDVEYEQTLLKTKNELERCYARKIDALNGKILQMEHEQTIRDRTDAKTVMKMETERDRLRAENEKLKARVQCLEKELLLANTTNENTLEHMHDLKECVKILNDELEKVKKSKLLYKERWFERFKKSSERIVNSI